MPKGKVVCTLQPRMFDDLKKISKKCHIKHKKYGKGGHKNLSDHIEAYFSGVTHVTCRDPWFVHQPSSSPNIFYPCLPFDGEVGENRIPSMF